MSAGCQPEAIPALEPTVTQPPAALVTRAANAPRAVATRQPVSAGLVFTPAPPEHTPTFAPPALTLIAPPTDAPGTLRIGETIEGRAIMGRILGDGPITLMLVGGIHGGWESNTVALINELIAYFEANPGDIAPGVRLLFVPVANPDGLLRGRVEAGRFNANGVDLNRNWGCGWSADARWRDQAVNAGAAPFSEPETRALAALIEAEQPATVLFYHSFADGIFAGDCEGRENSRRMTEVLGAATGYRYGQPFTAYRVTGTAAAWVDGLGIPSADVELTSPTDTEFARNRAGVRALQCWLAGC